MKILLLVQFWLLFVISNWMCLRNNWYSDVNLHLFSFVPILFGMIVVAWTVELIIKDFGK